MKDWNINRIITPVNLKYGVPMGRPNIGTQPHTITSGSHGRIFKINQPKIYDKQIPLTQGYDKGGVYWGLGTPLHVRFTPDLSYVEFYRMP